MTKYQINILLALFTILIGAFIVFGALYFRDREEVRHDAYYRDMLR